MLDIGWQELLVIGVLALLVVGPKELPKLLRTVGQWAGRARSVARDFQRSMEDAAREADLDELRNVGNIKRDMQNLARLDYTEQAEKAKPKLKGGKTDVLPSAGATASTGPSATPAVAPAPEAERKAADGTDG